MWAFELYQGGLLSVELVGALELQRLDLLHLLFHDTQPLQVGGFSQQSLHASVLLAGDENATASSGKGGSQGRGPRPPWLEPAHLSKGFARNLGWGCLCRRQVQVGRGGGSPRLAACAAPRDGMTHAPRPHHATIPRAWHTLRSDCVQDDRRIITLLTTFE